MEEAKGGFNIKYLLIGILFTLQVVGLYEHVWNIDPNLCEMTYMYNQMKYVDVALPNPIAEKYPRYNLYSYGEGEYANLLQAGLYTGQPVLFIPGNGGSHKQVRSLASVALRKSTDNEDEPRTFNFFTADLAEDLGALYGPSLQDQTEFISAVIPIIQGLYLTAKPVILIGHSMGGLVARAVLLEDSMDSSVVPLIISLATPHTAPPIPLDHHIQQFYDRVNSYWALEGGSSGGSVSGVALVSVGGGRNDVQVSPLAVNSPYSSVTSVSTAVPGCYASTDHLSIVWCKQLVLALVRGLFDSVDRRSLQLHNSTTRIAAIFDYHLITKHYGKQFVSRRHRSPMKLSSSAKWSESIKRQFDHQLPAKSQHTYIMVPVTGTPKSKYHQVSIRVRGLEEKDWIFACTANAVENNARQCSTGMNLSKQRSRLLDGGGGVRGKLAQVPLRPLLEEGYTHIVVSIPPSDRKVVVSVDVHGETERRVGVATPRLVSSFKPTPVLQSTSPRALLQEIVLEGLNEPWHSYDLSLLPSVGCSVNSSSHPPPQLWLTAHTSHRLANVPHRVDGNEFVYRIEQDEIALLPASDKSAESGGVPERGDQAVQIVLESRCQYSVSIKASLPGTMRRLLLLYGGQVPAFLVCHLMLALAMQLKSVGDASHCPSLLTSLLALTPMVVVPFIKLSAMALKKLEVYNDQERLSDSGMDLGVLPIFLFLSYLPLTLMVSGGVWLTVLTAGNALQSSAVRLFGSSTGAGPVVSELAFTGLSRVPAVVAVALLAVAYSTCGALAMALATAYYFIQLFDMYKDHVKKVILKLIPRLEDETPPEPPSTNATAANPTTDTTTTTTATSTSSAATTTTSSTSSPSTPATSGSDSSSTPPPEGVVISRKVVPQSNESLSLHLHLSMLLLCLVTALLQSPTLLTWAVRSKLGETLSADPTLWPAVACLAALTVIWQCSPCHNRRHYKLLGQLVHFAAVVSLVFAAISTYRLQYFIAGVLALVALHQLLAPTVSREQLDRERKEKEKEKEKKTQ